MATAPTSTQTVLKVYKAPDMETHLRVIAVDGLEVVELRDFIPSLGEYGRGYWVPNDPGILDALLVALSEVSNGARVLRTRSVAL